jgi:outer membrane protein assembly factor BamD (BamD/ComL family)
MRMFPNDNRITQSQKVISSLRTEQAHGNFEIAKYYERHRKWGGALVYYNEVLLHDPNSVFAAEARQRIDSLKPRALQTSK